MGWRCRLARVGEAKCMILNEALRYPHARTPNHFLAQTIDLSFNEDQPISVHPELVEGPGPNGVMIMNYAIEP